MLITTVVEAVLLLLLLLLAAGVACKAPGVDLAVRPTSPRTLDVEVDSSREAVRLELVLSLLRDVVKPKLPEILVSREVVV